MIKWYIFLNLYMCSSKHVEEWERNDLEVIYQCPGVVDLNHVSTADLCISGLCLDQDDIPIKIEN